MATDDDTHPDTQAELARWFELPSFEEVAERAPLRERRANAAASVDPALLEAIHQRNEVRPERVISFAARIEIRIKPEMGSLDHAMIDRGHAIAEPREVEIAEALRDDLKEVTPQALLRDLHRPETTFEKRFEIVDAAANQRFDIVAEVASAMASDLKLPPLDVSPFEQERRLLVEDRANRDRPWTQLPMRNRRVTE